MPLRAAQREPESRVEDATGSGAVAWGGGTRVIHIAVDPKISYCWSLAVASPVELHRSCTGEHAQPDNLDRANWTCVGCHTAETLVCPSPHACLFPSTSWPWLDVGCHPAMLEHVTEARAAVMRIIVSPPRERAASVPACVRTAPNEAAARRGLCTKILPAYEHRSKLQLHSHIGMMESMPSHGRSGSVSLWDC